MHVAYQVLFMFHSYLQWRELRRFMLKSLRDLGFGKTGSEEAILEESAVLVRNIKKEKQWTWEQIIGE